MNNKKESEHAMPEYACIEPEVGEKLIVQYPDNLSVIDKQKFESHLRVCKKCQQQCITEKFALDQFKNYAPEVISEMIFENVQELLKNGQYGEIADKFIKVFGLEALRKVLLFPFSFMRSKKPREALEWIIEILDRLSTVAKKPGLVYEAPTAPADKGGILTSAILYLVNTLSNHDIPDDDRKRIAEQVILALKEENKKYKSSSEIKKGYVL